MSDVITFECGRCGGTQFSAPSDTPGVNDLVTCAGCGDHARYADVQTAAVRHAQELFRKALEG